MVLVTAIERRAPPAEPPRPGLLTRVRTHARALRDGLDRSPPVPDPPASAPVSAPVLAPGPALVYAGLHFGEAGFDRNGIWTADSFTLPVPALRDALLRFKAFNPESLFVRHEAALQLPAAATVLRFSFGPNEVASYRLEGEGDFTVDCPLPAQGASVALLTVSLSRHFTPEAVYGTADPRRLSLLLKLVQVGGRDLVDNTARRPATPADEVATDIPGITVIGYLKGELGLGEAARSCMRSAQEAGIAVAGVDAGFASLHRQEDPGAAAGDDPQPVTVLFVNAEQGAPVLRQLATERPALSRARRTIGFWHWEQPDFPIDYLPCFAGLDEIWAPSSFVQAAISAIAPVPVLRMPHAVSAAASANACRAAFGLPEDVFLALATYDFYSYQHRKNPQAAIAAYRAAASTAPPMGLVIKTINGDKVPDAMAELRRATQDLPGIQVIDRYLNRQEMFDLEACCDCMISLHRAEGFGLGLAEMMRLGKPVIATGWSGNADFMTADNSMPVGYALAPLADDVGPYRAGSLWAEADVAHAAACLTRLARDPALGAAIGRRAQADMQTYYSPAAVGQLYRRRLAVLGLTMGDWREGPAS